MRETLEFLDCKLFVGHWLFYPYDFMHWFQAWKSWSPQKVEKYSRWMTTGSVGINSSFKGNWIKSKHQEPGDSSRDLFIPDCWRSLNSLKGSCFHHAKKRSRTESPGVNSCHESLLLLLLSCNCWSWVGRCFSFPKYRGINCDSWSEFWKPFQVFGSEAAEGQKQLFLRKGWSLVSGWGGGWSSMKSCLVSMQNHKWHKSKTTWLQLQANDNRGGTASLRQRGQIFPFRDSRRGMPPFVLDGLPKQQLGDQWPSCQVEEVISQLWIL